MRPIFSEWWLGTMRQQTRKIEVVAVVVVFYSTHRHCRHNKRWHILRGDPFSPVSHNHHRFVLGMISQTSIITRRRKLITTLIPFSVAGLCLMDCRDLTSPLEFTVKIIRTTTIGLPLLHQIPTINDFITRYLNII